MARPFLMDATVPRPTPRIPILPTPFTYEKPTPQVPDLSLIFDSSPSSNNNNHTQNSSSLLPPSSRDHSSSSSGNRLFPYTTNNNSNNNINDSRSCITSPQSSNMNKSMSFEVQVLYDIMKRQEEIITRMDNQIKHLVETQDNSFKSLIEHQDTQFEIIQDTLLKVLEISHQQQQLPKIKMTTLEEQGVQTDAIITNTNTTTSTTTPTTDKDYGTDRMIQKPIHHKGNCSNVNNTTNTRKDSPTSQNQQQQQQKQNVITTAVNMHTPSKLPNIERSRSASGSSSSSSSSSSSGNSHKHNSNNNNNNRKDAIASSSTANATNNNSGSNSPFNTQAQGDNTKNMSGNDHQQQQFQYRQSRAPFHGNSDFQYDNNNHSADFSGILKDIQLPTIRESSLFSEASIQPINLQDYNDSLNESDSENPHIGPSVSAYGTSDDDDDEVVQPTPTFYQNILGNVNKMLENNRTEATLYGSTDTTVYGMSSNNLSFATKEYLQRYGLVKPKKPTTTTNTNTNNHHHNNGKKQQQQYGVPENNRIFSNEEVPNNNNRILDMTALRNQPKLL